MDTIFLWTAGIALGGSLYLNAGIGLHVFYERVLSKAFLPWIIRRYGAFPGWRLNPRLKIPTWVRLLFATFEEQSLCPFDYSAPSNVEVSLGFLLLWPAIILRRLVQALLNLPTLFMQTWSLGHRGATLGDQLAQAAEATAIQERLLEHAQAREADLRARFIQAHAPNGTYRSDASLAIPPSTIWSIFL